MLDKLFKPLDYLKIIHSEKKWFDIILPFFFSILTVICLYSLPHPISIVGAESLISLVNGMLQILSGFYIASMAAIATFQREGMDCKMDGLAPTLKGQTMTRRGFLTYLFGYLASVSIMMYFVGGFVQLGSANLHVWFAPYQSIAKPFFLFVYLVIIFNIILTTVLGMHFMIDRINRTPKVLTDHNKDK